MFGTFSDETLAEFYAAYAEARDQTQKDCGPGERVVFGRCSKGDNMGNKKIDETQKKERQSDKPSDNSKPVMINGRKMGWAVRNGKKVLVDWGSVAGEKKVGPKPAANPKAKDNKPQAPAPAPKPAATLVDPNANSADRQAAINEIGRRTLAT